MNWTSLFWTLSGYVAILFGRNRTSEDVDIFVERFSDFDGFSSEIKEKGYWIVNEDPEKAESMLEEGLVIRVARKNTFEPNIEMKFPKRDTDFYSLKNRVRVILPSGSLFIGSLELNIAYKLFLGSEKDIEDARFLFRLLKENINMGTLDSFVRQLKVEDKFRRYLE